MKTHREKMIEVSQWDKLVRETYGKPYSFQQQQGCMARGIFRFGVPDKADDYENDSVPEKINGDEMGVSFAAWLARDPKMPVDASVDDWEIELFWFRNFYPNFQTLANDLHAQGHLEAGEYAIVIDW